MKGGKVSELFTNLPKFVSMFFRTLFQRQTPWRVRVLLIAALAYLLLPFDLIPDWLLGFGIVDDLTIVSLLTWLALRLLKNETDDNDPT
jgi:uncharacterized membrane protein YkvA (DUF1232 family)